jgi:preprotein translocase subunit Sss1
MKITRKQLKQLIKEETQNLKEYYPIGGRDTSPQWEAFKDAARTVAAGFIDAGMEADGIMSAMQDEIEQMIIEMSREDNENN